MKDDPANAFGKLRRDQDGGLAAWHPLIDHLTDVAACFERLCACHSMRRALERAAGRPLDGRDLARLAVLAFLHDLGKANSGFQAKRWAPGTAPWRGRLTDSVPDFEQISSNAPYPVQTAAGTGDMGALVILESETGSGKTEAAPWRFVQLFRRGTVDGLYFALPTRVAATQLYERVRAAVDRLWPDAPPLVVRALPGYAAARAIA